MACCGGMGAWSRKEEFQLKIKLPISESEVNLDRPVPLIIYFHLLGHREISKLRWEINGAAFQEIQLDANDEKLLRVRVLPNAEETESISVKCRQANLCDLQRHDPGDKRTVGIGLCSLMVCKEDDLFSRVTMLERASSYAMIDMVQRGASPSH